MIVSMTVSMSMVVTVTMAMVVVVAMAVMMTTESMRVAVTATMKDETHPRKDRMQIKEERRQEYYLHDIEQNATASRYQHNVRIDFVHVMQDAIHSHIDQNAGQYPY